MYVKMNFLHNFFFWEIFQNVLVYSSYLAGDLSELVLITEIGPVVLEL